jgi:hypothetical protein
MEEVAFIVHNNLIIFLWKRKSLTSQKNLCEKR